MKYYEVIFEDGSYSVATYESDDEALMANGLHNERAKNGELGGPAGHPATRVKRILKYDRHPAEFGAEKNMSSDVLASELSALLKEHGSVVDLDKLASQVRELSSPTVSSGPHDSNFKATESKELVLDWV